MSALKRSVEFESQCRQWVNSGFPVHSFEVEQFKEKWQTTLRRYLYLRGVRLLDGWKGHPMFEIMATIDDSEEVLEIAEEDLLRLWETRFSKGLRGMHCVERTGEGLAFSFAGRTEDGLYLSGRILLVKVRAAPVPVAA